MTDITKLAQSLKRRAASANEFGEGLFFIKADDVLALLEALDNTQAENELVRGQLFIAGRTLLNQQAKIAELALAAMDSEPVGFTDERNLHHIAMGRETSLIWGKQNSEAGDVPLYRHAQQPVVQMVAEESRCGTKDTPALDSLPKNAESRSGNSLANDTNVIERLTITLPDTSSKAFWSGTGKTETFHPVTYRRWVREAIERYCTIARIDVEVK